MNRLLSRILKRQVPTKKSLHHVCNTTLIPTMDLLTWFPKKHLWISCRLLVSSHRKHVACTCRDTFLIQWSHSLERSLYSNLWKRLDWIHDSFISWQLSRNVAGWWWTRSISCSNKVTCMSLSSSQLPNDNINCFWNEAVLHFTAVSWLLYSEIDLSIKWVSIWMFVDLPPLWTSNIVCSRKYIAPVNWRGIQAVTGSFQGISIFSWWTFISAESVFWICSHCGKTLYVWKDMLVV
jgi:hypothetical protein